MEFATLLLILLFVAWFISKFFRKSLQGIGALMELHVTEAVTNKLVEASEVDQDKLKKGVENVNHSRTLLDDL